MRGAEENEAAESFASVMLPAKTLPLKLFAAAFKRGILALSAESGTLFKPAALPVNEPLKTGAETTPENVFVLAAS